MHEKILTDQEWASLSAQSRHRINQFGVEYAKMKECIDVLEVYLSNVPIGLGNIGDVPDRELGWQVKILKLKIQELLGA